MTVRSVPDSPDQVARWGDVKFTYPQASYALADNGFFYGSLREDDIPLCRTSSKQLIDALLEQG